MATITVKTSLGPKTFTMLTGDIDKQVIVMLDHSGSMGCTDGLNAFTRLHRAKKAVEILRERVQIDKLVIFNDIVKDLSSDRLNEVKVYGGTCFHQAFDFVANYFKSGLNIIMLITDGATNLIDVNNSISTLECVAKNGVNVQVHSLGLIGAHANLLLKLAQTDIQGTALHVRNEMDSETEISKLADTFADLINMENGFKIADENATSDREVEPESLTEEEAVSCITALTQEVTKLPRKRAIEECPKLEVILAELTSIGAKDRGKFHDQIRLLLDISLNADLNDTDYQVALIKLCYGPESLKMRHLRNRQVIKNVNRFDLLATCIANPPMVFSELYYRQKVISTMTFDDPLSMYFVQPKMNTQGEYELDENGIIQYESTGDIFGVLLDFKKNEILMANPEQVEIVTLSSQFMGYGFYKESVMMYSQDPDFETKGVIQNMGIYARVFFPLIPSVNGWAILQQCVGEIMGGRLTAYTSRGIVAIPCAVFLFVLLNEEKCEWLQEIRELVREMAICGLTHNRNIWSQHEELFAKFGQPVFRTPDVVPSLDLFLVKFIVAKIEVGKEMIFNLFAEFARRYVRKQLPQWHPSQFWVTTVKTVEENAFEASSNSNHEELVLGIRQGSTMKTKVSLNDKLIEERFEQIKLAWIESNLFRILKKYLSETIPGEKEREDLCQVYLHVGNVFEFIAMSCLNSSTVKAEEKPDLEEYINPDIKARVEEFNAQPFLIAFKEAQSIEQIMAIIAYYNCDKITRQMSKYIKKLVYEGVEVKHWKHKTNGFLGTWRIAGDDGLVTFSEESD